VTAPRVELRGVGHAYGGRVVLAGVDRVLEPGRSLGLLGPNGSGKSTLLRCVAGLLRPRAGSVLVDGQESCELPPAERARVAYAGHRPLLWGGLSARENLVLSAGLYGLGAETAEAALELAGLAEAAERPAAALSQGQRQRLALARALLPSPQLLVLDEPHSGLDEASSARLDDLLSDARGGVTIVLATHERSRAELLCDELLHLEVLR
jgi:heme ABC exporter ATP-binding subunit CcmA